MVHRIEEREEFTGALAIAQHGKSDQGPERRVTILSPILAHARHVAFDVANIQLAFVEWWCKENYQPVAALNQILFYCCHRALRSITFSRTGNDRPRLHNRVDATFIVLHGTKRSAVIEVGPAIPVAVPTFFRQGLLQLLQMLAIAIAARLIVPLITQRRK